MVGHFSKLSRSLYWLGWAPVALFVNNNLYTLQRVTGRSMKPVLNPDDSSWRDVALFDRTVVLTGYKCKRGEVVALSSPIVPKTLLVKRVIALGGDTVQTLPPCPETEVVVPEGHAWVEGDEHFHSEDSNFFGAVPLTLIKSKLIFIVWPPARFGPLRPPSTEDEMHAPMHSPAWRRNNDNIARKRLRTARVRITPQYKDSV